MHILRILIQQYLTFYDLLHRCMKHNVVFIEVTAFAYIPWLFFKNDFPEDDLG
jgi:hypothetical protein